MPCDYKQYPDNWKWLSKQIISDAGNKCELCYAPNGAIVTRDQNVISANGYPWRYITMEDVADEVLTTNIILTVHHIDSNKQNSSKQNLIALCQRCHLRLDLSKHMAKRKLKSVVEQEVFLEGI